MRIPFLAPLLLLGLPLLSMLAAESSECSATAAPAQNSSPATSRATGTAPKKTSSTPPAAPAPASRGQSTPKYLFM